MLETSSNDARVDIPDVGSQSLLYLRHTMDRSKLPCRIGLDEALLRMCEKYDMPGLAYSVMLSTRPPHVHARDEKLRHFIWASRLDCAEAAVEMLLTINHSSHVSSGMPGSSGFNVKVADQLRPKGVFAVMKARTEVLEEVLVPKQAEQYYSRFASRLCEILMKRE